MNEKKSPYAKITAENNNIIVENNSFDLLQTLDCGQAFRFSEKDGIWQGVIGDRLLKMSQDKNKITFYDIGEDEFYEKYYDYFTLWFDYDGLKEKLRSDKIMNEAIDFASGIRMLKQDKWETICSFIISQNNNIPRIKGIIDRLCRTYGNIIDGCNEYSFPSANVVAKCTVDDLSPLRAGFRAKYIVDAAQKISCGEIDINALETIPLENAREELMKIKGVGPKVAECVLLFSCGRYDAFPLDVWIKRVMAVLYPNGLPKCAEEYKGIAQQYLFHYARSTKLADDKE